MNRGRPDLPSPIDADTTANDNDMDNIVLRPATSFNRPGSTSQSTMPRREPDGNQNSNTTFIQQNTAIPKSRRRPSLQTVSSRPLGFTIGGTSGEYPVSQQLGESLRGSSLSAPPPGFDSMAHPELGPPQRDRNPSLQRAAMMFQNHSISGDNNSAGPGYMKEFLPEDPGNGIRSPQSSSFSNLAAALGQGLAESMDDSFIDLSMQHSFNQSAFKDANRFLSRDKSTHLQSGVSPYDTRGDASSSLAAAISNSTGGAGQFGHLLPPIALLEASKAAALQRRIPQQPNYMVHGVPAGSENHVSSSQYMSFGDNVSNPRSQASQGVMSSLQTAAFKSDRHKIRGVDQDTLLSNAAQQQLMLEANMARSTSAPPSVFDSNPHHNRRVVQAQSHQYPLPTAVQQHQHQYNFTQNNISSSPSSPAPSPSSPSQLKLSNPSVFVPCNRMNSTPSPLSNPPDQSLLTDLPRQAEQELIPFLRDIGQKLNPSRGIAILSLFPLLSNHILSIQDIQSTAKAFGAVESFRSDFSLSRGVIFLSYYDLRSAQHAALELEGCLTRLSGSYDHRVKLRYCTPLNSSSVLDESTILLSGLPRDVDEDYLSSFMESYGGVRSVHYQIQHGSSTGAGEEEGLSYVVEFFDIQDSKHALLELESSHPWSEHVTVEVGMRNPTKRRQGREIMAMTGRWRHGGSGHGTNSPGIRRSASNSPAPPNPNATSCSSDSISPMPRAPSPNASLSAVQQHQDIRNHSSGAAVSVHQPPQPQLLISPDGQYSYVVLNQPAPHPPPPTQQVVQHGPHGTYVTTIPVHDPHQISYLPPHHMNPYPHISSSQQPQQYHHAAGQRHVLLPGTGANTATPYNDLQHRGVSYPVGSQPMYAVQHVGGASNLVYIDGNSNAHLGRKKGNSSNTSGMKHRNGDHSADNVHLSLNTEAIMNGAEKRTSLMVKNIPNKYTQKMLLDEFAQCGHGPTKIDFFYLPIDFKNRCNKGYAFINYGNYNDIPDFIHLYQGKQWKIFNSDKICDITYARIQGKTALMKKFEHSELMNKDEEYRPLVFCSEGENKGQKEEFPSNFAGGGGGWTRKNTNESI